MKNFLSIISFISLLFLSIQLSCSDNETENTIKTTKNSSTKKEQSVLQKLHGALTSEEAKSVAQGTAYFATTVASAIGNLGYQGMQLAASALTKNNPSTETNVHAKMKKANVESDSDSDSESEYSQVDFAPGAFITEESLKQALQNDEVLVLNEYNEFIAASFANNPEFLASQKTLHRVISIAKTGTHTTGSQFALNPALAAKHLPTQQKIFNESLAITAIDLKKAQDTKLKKAKDKYDKKLEKLANEYSQSMLIQAAELKIKSTNMDYFKKSAGISTNTEDRSISPSNFDDPKKFETLLEQYRTSREIKTPKAPEQNNRPATPPTVAESTSIVAQQVESDKHQQFEAASVEIHNSSENHNVGKNKKGKR